MTAQTALAVAAGLVALAFALSTFERWLAARKAHELLWSVALAQFALASLALAAGAALGWNGAWFRTFYFFGAIANVPFLALGTVALLTPRAARLAVPAVSVAIAFAGGVVAVAPFTAAIPSGELPRGSEVFGALPRVLVAAASGAAAIVIVGGAVWSAWRFRRGRMLWSNVLIATGTLITGASGLFNSVLDEMDAFSVSLLVGVAVLFAGFLVGTAAPRRQEPVTRSARRSALPPSPRGISSTNSTRVGHL